MPTKIPSFCKLSKTTKEKGSVFPLSLWNLVPSVWKDDLGRTRSSTFVSIPNHTICINDLFLSCIKAYSPELCSLGNKRQKESGIGKKKLMAGLSSWFKMQNCILKD